MAFYKYYCLMVQCKKDFPQTDSLHRFLGALPKKSVGLVCLWKICNTRKLGKTSVFYAVESSYFFKK